MEEQIISVVAAARRYQISPQRWQRAIYSGRVPGPTHSYTVSGLRKGYTLDEAARIALALCTDDQSAGTITVNEAAETVGRHVKTVYSWCNRYDVGAKTRSGRRYLTNQDLKKLYTLMGLSPGKGAE